MIDHRRRTVRLSLRQLAICATLLLVFLSAVALSELNALRGSQTAAPHATPTFLTRALGVARPKASLVRTPAPMSRSRSARED